jgi:7-carboxy-7-deazaguanine synthase
VSTLVVNQVYGPVWQGEGPSSGVLASVIRLMGCNLSCRWATAFGASPCDESQTWNARLYDLAGQGTRMEAAEIAARALACRPRLVIITGGEPLLHAIHPGWRELLACLDSPGRWHRPRIEVETNGTQRPDFTWSGMVDQWNVSPKLASSGMPRERAACPEALAWFAASRRAVFKFVVTSPADLTEVESWVSRFSLPEDRIWVMPAGTTRGEVLATATLLAPAVLARRFNLTLRQHALVFEEGEPRE